jgi:hypothetical protein
LQTYLTVVSFQHLCFSKGYLDPTLHLKKQKFNMQIMDMALGYLWHN